MSLLPDRLDGRVDAVDRGYEGGLLQNDQRRPGGVQRLVPGRLKVGGHTLHRRQDIPRALAVKGLSLKSCCLVCCRGVRGPRVSLGRLCEAAFDHDSRMWQGAGRKATQEASLSIEGVEWIEVQAAWRCPQAVVSS